MKKRPTQFKVTYLKNNSSFSTEKEDRQFSNAEEMRFKELFQQHRKWALHYAQASGVEDPELDMLEAFRKAMLYYRPELGSFGPLLWRILNWQLKSSYRREVKRRNEPFAEDYDVIDEGAQHRETLRELQKIINLALESLSPRDRDLFRQFYEEEKSIKQIAQRRR